MANVLDCIVQEGEKSGDDESGADESDDDVLSDAEQQLKSKIFELMGDAAINMDGMLQ